jgi:protein involved in polysaccharide export with SLBB domain
MAAISRAAFAACVLALGLGVAAYGGIARAQAPGYQQGPYVVPNVPPPTRSSDARNPGPVASPGQLPGLTGQSQTYRLGSGDRIRITVFGEPDLTGEFEISSVGIIAFPLVGEVPTRGLSPRELETKLTGLLKDGFLINPRVNVEVINYRPFFILGEVTKPGGYPFIASMTVVTAVALAGGYTPRANKRHMTIVRNVDHKRQEIEATEETPLFPEDIITVRERFF